MLERYAMQPVSGAPRGPALRRSLARVALWTVRRNWGRARLSWALAKRVYNRKGIG